MKYFRPQEYRCLCHRPNCDARLELAPALAEKLDALRERVGPVYLTSGIRCAWWNAREGGVPGSAHETGEAVDIAADTSQARFAMLRAAVLVGFERVGIHQKFVHVDTSQGLPRLVCWLYPPPSKEVPRAA